MLPVIIVIFKYLLFFTKVYLLEVVNFMVI